MFREILGANIDAIEVAARQYLDSAPTRIDLRDIIVHVRRFRKEAWERLVELGPSGNELSHIVEHVEDLADDAIRLIDGLVLPDRELAIVIYKSPRLRKPAWRAALRNSALPFGGLTSRTLPKNWPTCFELLDFLIQHADFVPDDDGVCRQIWKAYIEQGDPCRNVLMKIVEGNDLLASSAARWLLDNSPTSDELVQIILDCPECRSEAWRILVDWIGDPSREIGFEFYDNVGAALEEIARGVSELGRSVLQQLLAANNVEHSQIVSTLVALFNVAPELREQCWPILSTTSCAVDWLAILKNCMDFETPEWIHEEVKSRILLQPPAETLHRLEQIAPDLWEAMLQDFLSSATTEADLLEEVNCLGCNKTGNRIVRELLSRKLTEKTLEKLATVGVCYDPYDGRPEAETEQLKHLVLERLTELNPASPVLLQNALREAGQSRQPDYSPFENWASNRVLIEAIKNAPDLRMNAWKRLMQQQVSNKELLRVAAMDTELRPNALEMLLERPLNEGELASLIRGFSSVRLRAARRLLERKPLYGYMLLLVIEYCPELRQQAEQMFSYPTDDDLVRGDRGDLFTDGLVFVDVDENSQGKEAVNQVNGLGVRQVIFEGKFSTLGHSNHEFFNPYVWSDEGMWCFSDDDKSLFPDIKVYLWPPRPKVFSTTHWSYSFKSEVPLDITLRRDSRFVGYEEFQYEFETQLNLCYLNPAYRSVQLIEFKCEALAFVEVECTDGRLLRGWLTWTNSD